MKPDVVEGFLRQRRSSVEGDRLEVAPQGRGHAQLVWSCLRVPPRRLLAPSSRLPTVATMPLLIINDVNQQHLVSRILGAAPESEAAGVCARPTCHCPMTCPAPFARPGGRERTREVLAAHKHWLVLCKLWRRSTCLAVRPPYEASRSAFSRAGGTRPQMPRCGEAVVIKDTGLSPAISPASLTPHARPCRQSPARAWTRRGARSIPRTPDSARAGGHCTVPHRSRGPAAAQRRSAGRGLYTHVCARARVRAVCVCMCVCVCNIDVCVCVHVI